MAKHFTSSENKSEGFGRTGSVGDSEDIEKKKVVSYGKRVVRADTTVT